LLLISAGRVSAAHEVTQSIDLQPGWNSIFLEVQPASNDTVSVFSGLPISSVWTWIPKDGSAQFFDDLSEELQDDPHWLVFFPTNRHERMFNDLYRVFANRSYFIKLLGTTGVTWTVSGRPAVPAFTWQPNSFNLVGFPLDPAGALPTLQSFLSADASLATQAVYRLNATGAWERVTNPAAQNVRAAESLWVYAGGPSTYLGPLQVTVSEGDGLDYGGSVPEKDVVLKNLGSAPTVVSIRNTLGATGPVAYWSQDAGTGEQIWTDLPDPLTVNLTAGQSYTLRLAIQRDELAGGLYESTIEVAADNGTRVRIPLRAETTSP
jgi:hypothetical protein